MEGKRSQSLWNRAVSYDLWNTYGIEHYPSQSLWNRAVSYDNRAENLKRLLNSVSIPLEQGSVLRLIEPDKHEIWYSVSIPLEQGSVLRQNREETNSRNLSSQSLWNRAVSYDCSGVIKPCATRLTKATSQLFPRLRELGLDLAKC